MISAAVHIIFTLVLGLSMVSKTGTQPDAPLNQNQLEQKKESPTSPIIPESIQNEQENKTVS